LFLDIVPVNVRIETQDPMLWLLTTYFVAHEPEIVFVLVAYIFVPQ